MVYIKHTTYTKPRLFALMLLATLVALSQQGKCPFGYGASGDDQQTGGHHHHNHPRVLDDIDYIKYPSEILTCTDPNKVLTTPASFARTTYEAIVRAVITLFDSKTATEQTNFAACMLRLAGHDFMDFRDNDGVQTGGSDGCVNFNDTDNIGLEACLNASNINSVYQSYCGQASLADFIVISAEALMTRTATYYNSVFPFAQGTLGEKFRNRFRAGRTTKETCPENVGLMPDAELGCDHLQAIFISHIYKQCVGYSTTTRNNGRRNEETVTVVDETSAWRFTAAISGAHTLGQARLENSGFNGHWSDLNNQGKFNNDYYRSLLLKGWGPELQVNFTSELRNTTKNQWERIDRDVESNGHHELMLNSDMCLAYRERRSNNFLTARSNFNCCGWTDVDILFSENVLIEGQSNAYCGTTLTRQQGRQRQNCCADHIADDDGDGDCDDEDDPKGPAIAAVMDFAASESDFLHGYTQAWWLATENGFLSPTFSCLPSGSSANRDEEDFAMRRLGLGPTSLLLYTAMVSFLLIFQF